MFKLPVVDHIVNLPVSDVPHPYSCKCFSVIIQLTHTKLVVNLDMV